MAPGQFEIMSEESVRFSLPDACSNSSFEVVAAGTLKGMNPKMFPILLKTDPLAIYYKLQPGTIIFVPQEFRYYRIQ